MWFEARYFFPSKNFDFFLSFLKSIYNCNILDLLHYFYSLGNDT